MVTNLNLRKANAAMKFFVKAYENTKPSVQAVLDYENSLKTKFDLLIVEVRKKSSQVRTDNWDNNAADIAVAACWIIDGAFKLFLDNKNACMKLSWSLKRRKLIVIARELNKHISYVDEFKHIYRTELTHQMSVSLAKVLAGEVDGERSRKALLFQDSFRFALLQGV